MSYDAGRANMQTYHGHIGILQLGCGHTDAGRLHPAGVAPTFLSPLSQPVLHVKRLGSPCLP